MYRKDITLEDKVTYVNTVNDNRTKIIINIAAINILLAVVAFLKDIALASYFGTSEASDAFVTAFFIPDMIGNNLLANAVGISCIPVFSRLLVCNKHKLLKSSFYKINIFTFLLACFVSLVIFLFKDAIVALMGSGFRQSMMHSSVVALNIMLFTIPLYPAIYIGISMLQVRGRFAIAAIAPVFYNLIFLIGITISIFLGMPINAGIKWVSSFVLGSVFGMFILVYIALYFRKSIIDNNDKQASVSEHVNENLHIEEFFKLFACYGCILLLGQTTLYVERLLALNYAIGGISGLNYAYRLSQLPIWVIIAAIGTVILPMMSKASVKKENAERILLQAIGQMIIIIVPIIIMLYILRVPLITILFERGAFDQESVKITADILKSYSLAILGQSVSILCLRYFISIREVRKPFIIFLSSTLLNIVLDCYFVRWLGLEGLGYGAAIAGILSALLSLHYIGFKLKPYANSLSDIVIKFISINLYFLALALFYLSLWKFYFIGCGILGTFAFSALTSVSFLLSYYFYLKHFKLI